MVLTTSAISIATTGYITELQNAAFPLAVTVKSTRISGVVTSTSISATVTT